MRNPAGSIHPLHLSRDPRSPAPGAQVVSLVPSEPGRGLRDRVVEIAGQSKQAESHPAQPVRDCGQLAGEVLTLRIGKRSAWRLAAMGAVVIMAVCAMGSKAPATFCAVGAIYLGVAWAHGVGHRVRVGIGGVTSLNLFGKSRRLHWSDVRSVSFPHGEMVIHGEGRCRVRVPSSFDGHRAAIRLLRIRLPREALDQSRIGLETHYLGQWDDCE